MLIDPAFAQAAGAGGSSSFLISILPLVFIFAILYLMIIRPQNKRMRDHRSMIENLRRGDTVVTGGGVVGKVAAVDGNEATVEIADGVKIKVVKSTITEVGNKPQPADAKPADDKK